MMGYENFFYVQDGGMKFSVIVRNHPPPWYPGLKMTTPLVDACQTDFRSSAKTLPTLQKATVLNLVSQKNFTRLARYGIKLCDRYSN